MEEVVTGDKLVSCGRIDKKSIVMVPVCHVTTSSKVSSQQEPPTLLNQLVNSSLQYVPIRVAISWKCYCSTYVRTHYVKCVLCMHSPVRSLVESDFSISCLVLLMSSWSVVSD